MGLDSVHIESQSKYGMWLIGDLFESQCRAVRNDLLEKHAAAIMNFVVGTPAANVSKDLFIEATAKLLCYYGIAPSGDRYLLNYQDCISKTKLYIVNVFPWDDTQSSVLNVRRVRAADCSSAGSSV